MLYHVYGAYRGDNEYSCLFSGTLEDCRAACQDMDKNRFMSLEICEHSGLTVEWCVIHGNPMSEAVR